jgi:hypothetical protein
VAFDNSFDGLFVHLGSHYILQGGDADNNTEKYSSNRNLGILNVLMVVVFKLHAVLGLGRIVEIQFINEPAFLINQSFVCFVQHSLIKIKFTEILR